MKRIARKRLRRVLAAKAEAILTVQWTTDIAGLIEAYETDKRKIDRLPARGFRQRAYRDAQLWALDTRLGLSEARLGQDLILTYKFIAENRHLVPVALRRKLFKDGK